MSIKISGGMLFRLPTLITDDYPKSIAVAARASSNGFYSNRNAVLLNFRNF